MSSSPKYRPLITSLAFIKQNTFLPFRYNFNIEQIVEIKKYLPKNLFKLHGIDVDSQSLTKQHQEALQKAKLKIKAVKGISKQNQKSIQYFPKQQVKIVEWYNKSISLQIPYSSRSSEAIIQQHVSMHLSYYIENFMFFKNTLTEELYTSLNAYSIKLTTDQIATETDIVFTNWNIQPQPTDDKVKMIRINVPVLLCLNLNEKYELVNIKQLIKSDIMSSISILLKNSFNTRVIVTGEGQKQFICLNSYALQQNAFQQQQKLRAIIGQQKNSIIQTQYTQLQAKKDKTFLIIVLATLVLFYFVLKIYPIHGRDQAQYLVDQQKAQQFINSTISDEEIF